MCQRASFLSFTALALGACGGATNNGGSTSDAGMQTVDAGHAGDSGTQTADAGQAADAGEDAGNQTNDAGDSGPRSSDAGDAGSAPSDGGDGKTCTRLTAETALLASPLPTNDLYSDPVSDGAYAYFGGESALYRVPVTGGPLETVTTKYLSGYASLAANTGTVVWEFPVAGTQNPAGLTIQNASGAHDVVPPSGDALQAAMVVDAQGDVFFAFTLADSTTQFEWWHPSTGMVTALAGVGTPQDGASLYFASGGLLIWQGNGAAGFGVYATEIATGAAHLLDTPQAEFGSLIGVDTTRLYGAGGVCPQSACPFTIAQTPLDGGAPNVAYSSTTSYWAQGITADATGIYWVDWTTNAMYHAAFGGSGSATSIAALDGGVVPSHFALDDCNVYWTNANGTGATQQVMAAPK